MKVCLTTKLEISKEKEITDLLKLHFPECNIKIIVKPRKYTMKEVKKVEKVKKVAKSKKVEKVTRVRKRKPKEIKLIPYKEAEWLKDRIYEKEMQEEGIQQLIDYYTKIKMEVEQTI